MELYETERQWIDISNLALAGRILDIGGGGEGVISRHSGDRVVAIDLRYDELAETQDIGLKVVMDACKLGFLNDYFDTATCFFTLMYMDDAQLRQCLAEAYRVLKPGGCLRIWDAVIPADLTTEVFIAQLEVKVSDELTISTGYGVRRTREQSLAVIRDLCERAGFTFLCGDERGEVFSLCLLKHSLEIEA